MAMKNAIVTITGNIGNDPSYNTTRTGDAVVNFRVGSSSGHWNRSTGAWVDDGTSWFAVSAFRNLAEHAKGSLRRGDPVIVTGALKVKEWENDGRKGTSADIVADAIGHDLSQGTSAFVRRPKPTTTVERAPAVVGERDDAPAYETQPTAQTDEWEAHGMNVSDAVREESGEQDSAEQEPAFA